MRAPLNAATGTSGQSFVKSRFEAMGWGVSSNTEHDLGTDLWLMVRDSRRFEMRLLIGAQVKSGEYWFKAKQSDGDDVVGWWFRESDDSHFSYWEGHAVPHILVLHRPTDDKCFWVHLTEEAIVSTGKGRKVLVPAASSVDPAHLGALMSVATSRQPVVDWQGSAWEITKPVQENDRLRYALLVPRLIAQHPNNRPQSLTAEQAIAVLTQMRLRDLERFDPAQAEVETSSTDQSDEWAWTFYAALKRWAVYGQMEGLVAAVATASTARERAAATVAFSAAHCELGQIAPALQQLENELAKDDHSPVDHAWLVAHLARCLVEQGDLERARALALDVFHVGRTEARDPTASLLTGTLAELIFMLGDWVGDELAQAVQGRDNVATWWRSQTLVSGLSSQFTDDFRTWAGDSSEPWAAEDTAWLRIRSAMLLAGNAADSPSWRHAAGLLARRVLMNGQNDEAIANALDVLRVAGAHELLELAIGRLVNRGPTRPLATVVSGVHLELSTRTSMRADLGLLNQAGDVLQPEDALRHARWLISAICRVPDLEEELRPTFFLGQELVRALTGVCIALPAQGESEVRAFVTELPPQDDYSLALGYANLLGALDQQQWSDEEVQRLLARPPGDQPAFTIAVEALHASRSATFRASLLPRVADGDLDALQSYGSVTDLPADVVATLTMRIGTSLGAGQWGAPAGITGLDGRGVLRALVLLNAWHPQHADWAAVVTALGDRNPDVRDLVESVDLLARVADEVPADVAAALDGPLAAIAERAQVEPDTFDRHRDVAGRVQHARARLCPDRFTDVHLRALMRGDNHSRAAAAEIVIRRHDPNSLTLVAALARDEDPIVRARIAYALGEWLMADRTAEAVVPLLEELLGLAGLEVGRALSAALDEDRIHEGLRPLLDLMAKHPSAVVRFRSSLVQANLDARADLDPADA